MPSSSRRLLLAALTLTFLVCVARAEARSGFTPSADMARVYVESGNRFGVAPRLLAAIGYNESRHGRSRLPGVSDGINRAGCCAGPAQLCVVRSCGRSCCSPPTTRAPALCAVTAACPRTARRSTTSSSASG